MELSFKTDIGMTIAFRSRPAALLLSILFTPIGYQSSSTYPVFFNSVLIKQTWKTDCIVLLQYLYIFVTHLHTVHTQSIIQYI